MAKASSTALEGIIRANVKALLKEHYDGKPGRMARINKAVTLSRLQEFLDGGNCYVSSLQSWADAFGVKPYHLMVKDLNVKDPPELVSSKKLRQIEKLKQDLSEE